MKKCCLVRAVVMTLAGMALGAVPAGSAAPPALEQLDEVVVEGRVPGPPLWKISSGDHVLWVLPLVDIFPKNIEWDSTQVEKLLAGSQEYLYKPRNGSEFPRISAASRTIVRTMLAGRKLTNLPPGTTLSDLLPPELHQRLLALRSRYFPKRKISNLTIWQARWVLEDEILEHERLAMLDYAEFTSPLPITEKLLKWLNKSKLEIRTYTSSFETSAVTSKQLKQVSNAVEKLVISSEALKSDVACMEKAVTFFETQLGAAKRRANAWARGLADGLVNPTRLYTEGDSCRNPPLEAIFKGHPSLEQFLNDNPAFVPDYAATDRKRRELWLKNAERALATNTRTFGVLSVNDILDNGGLVSTLESRGYKVEVFASAR
jgi:hypothetical protein